MGLDIYIREFKLENRQSGETVSFKPYGGNIGVTVFGKERGQMPFKANLSNYTLKMLEKMIEAVRKGSPGHKVVLKKERWNPETKQASIDWMITLSKDDKMVYHLILTNVADGGRQFDFVFRGQFGISIGSDPMSDADKSSVHLDELEDWIQTAKIAKVFTDEKFDPNNRQGGNRGGNNNYQNHGNGGSGYSRPAEGGGDDGIPF